MPAHLPTLRARAAFTLLEVLIALALVTALTGLVGVAVLPRLHDASEREARAQLIGALSLAHQHARRLGEPVRLVARSASGGRTQIVLLAWDTREDDPLALASPEEGAVGEIDVGRIAFDEDAPSTDEGRTSFDREGRGRVLLEMPPGFEVLRLTPEQREAALAGLDDAMLLDGALLEEQPPGGATMAGPDEGTPITIAVFLPDGSVIAGEPPLVRTPDGSLLEVRINPWTARATLAELSAPGEMARSAGEVAEHDGTREVSAGEDDLSGASDAFGFDGTDGGGP